MRTIFKIKTDVIKTMLMSDMDGVQGKNMDHRTAIMLSYHS